MQVQARLFQPERVIVLVVTNLHMPNINGFELLRRQREHDTLA